MQYSARNQLKGKVTSVKLAGVMAEVGIELPGGQQIVSAITRESV
ncbi:MAG: TOBE domain-containing protein, partial [Chloroflexi bacterium]|nr:TOBE domain-containing protein [Chloroflexota bacterium]